MGINDYDLKSIRKTNQKTMRNIPVLFGIICFWMFSPESYSLIGTRAGLAGFWAIIVLILFSLGIMLALQVVANAREHNQAVFQDAGSFPHSIWALVLGFSALIGSTLFASTGILVTAGFTFNEVFYYRFPNFAFAFLLLAAIIAIQWCSPKVYLRLHAVFVLIGAVCLLFLVVYGMLTESVFVGPSWSTGNTSFVSLVPLVLVFIGFEQMFLANIRKPVSSSLMYAIVIIASLVLAGWMLVSLKFVPAERLGSSTISYMTAAVQVMGQKGRLIMGMAIIAGSCGAVSGLLRISCRFVETMCGNEISFYVRMVASLLLGIIIALLMSAGVAGSDKLEIYIRGSLLLWLIYSSLFVMAAAVQLHDTKRFYSATGLILSSAIIVCALIMIILLEEREILTMFFLCSLAGSTLCVLLLKQMHRLLAFLKKR